MYQNLYTIWIGQHDNKHSRYMDWLRPYLMIVWIISMPKWLLVMAMNLWYCFLVIICFVNTINNPYINLLFNGVNTWLVVFEFQVPIEYVCVTWVGYRTVMNFTNIIIKWFNSSYHLGPKTGFQWIKSYNMKSSGFWRLYALTFCCAPPNKYFHLY